MVQLADPVGLQQRWLRQCQFAALQVFVTQTVPTICVEAEIAVSIRRFDTLVEELPRFRHPILTRAQGSQLDQDLRQILSVLGVEPSDGTLDPRSEERRVGK